MISRLTFVLLSLLALAGCESTRNDFSTGVREKFAGPTYVVREFPGDPRAVFEAARASVEQMGFSITRSGAAQGVVEGVSGLTSDDRLRGSRQRSVKVRLASTVAGATEVSVLFTEIIEDDSSKGAGLATETPLRNSPLYAALFERMTETLAR
jgi:hypothetical protein